MKNKLITQAEEIILPQADVFDSWQIIKAKMASHIPEVIKWTKYLSKEAPEANIEIVLLGAWLHDCGLIMGRDFLTTDHAILGEIRAREILLSLGAREELIKSVTHIVRCHRNRDVKPETIEAKIVVAADSTAHFTDGTHESIMTDERLGGMRERAKFVLAKLERDWRDVNQFSFLAKKLEKSYLKKRKKLFSIAGCII